MTLKDQKRLVSLLAKGATAHLSECSVVVERAANRILRFDIEVAKILLSAGVIEQKGDQLLANECSKTWMRRVSLPQDVPQKAVQPTTTDTASYQLGFARLKSSSGVPFFDPHHLLAAQKFTHMFEVSGQRPHITVNYDSFHVPKTSHGAASLTMSEHAVTAQQSLNHIHERLGGELYNMLVDICVFEKGLGQVEKERHWPRRSGKFMLKVALDQLAVYWSLQASATRATTGRTRHSWRAHDRLPLRP